MVAGEKTFDVVFVGVEVVDDGSGVVVDSGGEDVDVEVFVHGVQEHLAEGTDVEADFVRFGVYLHLVLLVFFHRVD